MMTGPVMNLVLAVLLFTIVLVVITLSGSIWVMFHMNANMMPTMTHEQAKNLP